MTVDLTDPESIAAWIEVWPERHIGQLRGIYRLQPAFRWQITEAVRLHKERNDETRALGHHKEFGALGLPNRQTAKREPHTPADDR